MAISKFKQFLISILFILIALILPIINIFTDIPNWLYITFYTMYGVSILVLMGYYLKKSEKIKKKAKIEEKVSEKDAINYTKELFLDTGGYNLENYNHRVIYVGQIGNTIPVRIVGGCDNQAGIYFYGIFNVYTEKRSFFPHKKQLPNTFLDHLAGQMVEHPDKPIKKLVERYDKESGETTERIETETPQQEITKEEKGGIFG